MAGPRHTPNVRRFYTVPDGRRRGGRIPLFVKRVWTRCCCRPRIVAAPAQGVAMLLVLIGILIICVIGAICFWAIEKFVRDGRLANLLKLLVVLICLAAILQRLLPFLGIHWL